MKELGPSLIEAAPWIDAFAGRTILVKLGGDVLARPTSTKRIVDQLATMSRCGIPLIVVHGAGAQIDAACRERNIPIEKVDGRRITSPEARDVIVDVLAGLNRDLCDQLVEAAQMVHGFDDGATQLIRAVRRPPRDMDGRPVDFGEVGDIVEVRIEEWDRNSILVLPSLAVDEGGQYLNVNADTVASTVAIAADCIKIVFLTSVAGIMMSPDDPGPVSTMTHQHATEILASGAVSGGMKAKLQECLRALEGHVSEVHIISGRGSFTLLREVFTDEGCGTLITRDEME